MTVKWISQFDFKSNIWEGIRSAGFHACHSFWSTN